MLDIRYQILQGRGQWWVAIGSDQLGPFPNGRLASEAAEVEVGMRKRMRHMEALRGEY